MLGKKQTAVTSSSVTETTVTIEIPDIEAGNYNVRIRLGDKAESNNIRIKVSSKIISYNENLSTLGGTIVINGKGLPEKWPSSLFSLSLISNGIPYDVEPIETNANSLKIVLAEGMVNQIWSFTIKNPIDEVHKMNIKLASENTPSLSLVTSSPIDADIENEIVLNRTNLPAIAPSFIKLYPTIEDSQEI